MNNSKRSTMPAGHHSDSDSTLLPLPKSAIIWFGGIFENAYLAAGLVHARTFARLLDRFCTISSLTFSLFWISASSFQSPRSPVLCFFSLYSFLLRVFSYNITPPQFQSSFGVHQLPFSLLSLLYLLRSFSPHGSSFFIVYTQNGVLFWG